MEFAQSLPDVCIAQPRATVGNGGVQTESLTRLCTAVSHVSEETSHSLTSDTPLFQETLDPATLVQNVLQEGRCPTVLSILTTLQSLWQQNQQGNFGRTQLYYAEELKRVEPDDPLDSAVLLCLLHLEMLFGPVPSPLRSSLRSTYWLIHHLASKSKTTVSSEASFSNEALEILRSSDSADTGSHAADVYRSIEAAGHAVVGLFGDALTHRVSVVAHDEGVLFANWALRQELSTPAADPFEDFVDVARRQLRTLDPITKALDGVVLYLRFVLRLWSGGHKTNEPLRKGLLVCSCLAMELAFLCGSVAYVVSRAMASFSFNPIITPKSEALWLTWVSFGKPLRLLHERLTVINHQLVSLLSPAALQGCLDIPCIPLVLPPPTLFKSLRSLKESATASVIVQVRQLIGQHSSTASLIDFLMDGVAAPLPPKQALTHYMTPSEKSVSTSERVPLPPVGSMVAAFDSDFSELLANSRGPGTAWKPSSGAVEDLHVPEKKSPTRYSEQTETPAASDPLSSATERPHSGAAGKASSHPTSLDQPRGSDAPHHEQFAVRVECPPLWPGRGAEVYGDWKAQPSSGGLRGSVLGGGEFFGDWRPPPPPAPSGLSPLSQWSPNFPTFPPPRIPEEQDMVPIPDGFRQGPGLCNAVLPPAHQRRTAADRGQQPDAVSSRYEWEISFSELTIEEKIGSGATSSVYRGSWRGTEVAVKKMTSSLVDTNEMNKFRREIQILLKLRHPNLTLLMGASVRSRPYFVVMEYCKGGDLFTLLHLPDATPHRVPQLSIYQKLKIAMDIAKGMTYLHKLTPQVIHRDLKSLNILLTNVLRSPFDEPHAKITDFGLSQLRTPHAPDAYQTAAVGTFHWMAPEVLMSQPYNETVDVYSFGILLYEIFSQTIPYASAPLPAAVHGPTTPPVAPNPVNLALAVCQGHRPNLSCIPRDVPAALIALMTSCWSQESRKRPGFEEVLSALKHINQTLPR